MVAASTGGHGKTQAEKESKETASTASAEGGSRFRSWLWENVKSIAVAAVLFLIVRAFVIQAFRIPSASMEDTLLIGDFLFVNKFLYGAKVPGLNSRLPGFRDIERGDVVVFKNPVDRKTDYIKRCVAVAGDTVAVRDYMLHINGEPQQEQYVKLTPSIDPRTRSWGPYVVPPEHFFAMGDNRNNSRDSRFFGSDGAREYAVPNDLVVGKAMIIYFSHDNWVPRLNRMFDLVR